MIPIFKAWADAARFGFEAQQVMAARVMRIGDGGPASAIEAQRMVGEKMLAMWESQARIGLAVLGGASMAQAALPFRRAVRSNHRRLTRRRRKVSKKS